MANDDDDYTEQMMITMTMTMTLLITHIQWLDDIFDVVKNLGAVKKLGLLHLF